MKVMNIGLVGVFSALTTLGALGVGEKAQALTFVSPNNLANAEGNLENSFPFNNPMRYQQVYAAADFGALSQLITRLSFRPDARFGQAFSSTLPDIQFNLSTTTKALDGLSSIFADNVGADDTVVYNRGSLTLASAFTDAAGGSKAFDINIDLTTPFLYDPTAGNLLLDVRNFGGGATPFFDAEFTSGDSVSRLLAYDPNSTTNDDGDTLGLVTQFSTTSVAVPFDFNPAEGAVLGLPLFIGLGMLRKKKLAQKSAAKK